MKQTDYTMRVIEPEEGFFLTQKGEVHISERIITSDKIYLAATASVEDWVEISKHRADSYSIEQAEYHALEEERMRLAEEEMRNGEVR
jgi:hypothetical protein